MALSDVCFQQEEGQAFILEIADGVLNAPEDIIVEAEGGQFPVMETEGGSNIFIMSE